jgi:uncharacterized protein (TIGR02246 family)
MKPATPLALILALSACTQAPPPAPDTREADAQAIRSLEAAFAKDAAAKDADKAASYYAPDASMLMPNMPIMTGSAAITAGWKDFVADPNYALSFESSKVEVSKAGDLAYSRGVYSFTFTDPKAKRPVTEKGKYVLVYAKQADGSWKVVADVGNPDAPAAPAK